ncbi:hypothetical protein A249_21225, partial [Pseudomonas syringae pv. actinidiae ICMP 18804]
RALPATGFADQPEGFAAHQAQRHTVDCFQGGVGFEKATADAEFTTDVVMPSHCNTGSAPTEANRQRVMWLWL